MCGRFTLRSSGNVVAEVFGVAEAPKRFPRFNIAPGQPVAVVPPARVDGRELALLHWGPHPRLGR